jgi:glucose/arabinose dehydrogenase
MKKNYLFLIILFSLFQKEDLSAQDFIRSFLPATFDAPFEMTYGSDDYLWISDILGTVCRVNPSTGEKQIVYQAPDYFGGSPNETEPNCQRRIKGGTLGLDLHPDFIKGSPYIYFMYSYNSGIGIDTITKFKIRRLTWDSNTKSITNELDIITGINSGYDHLGGRLMVITQDETPYIFVTIGDHGLSQMNDPDCYPNQMLNPNSHTQDPYTQQGKIHRFHLDGSIPDDNPIAGNSFYSRGHRNPQGLMYNHNQKIIYDIEHGDRTDDEINEIRKGMNYGWREVRGYHDDNNFPGESDYIANYTPNPAIENDQLIEAFYSWCNVYASNSPVGLDWCTVAPSDGIYYDCGAIPEWQNSLLVVTLKNGISVDRCVYQFKLKKDGSLVPSTFDTPNPKQFFAEDANGRLRDITYSPDGNKIYLLNNHGISTNRITVYTHQPKPEIPYKPTDLACIQLNPNSVVDVVSVKGLENFNTIHSIQINTMAGKFVREVEPNDCEHINLSSLERGLYVMSVFHDEGTCTVRFFKQ